MKLASHLRRSGAQARSLNKKNLLLSGSDVPLLFLRVQHRHLLCRTWLLMPWFEFGCKRLFPQCFLLPPGPYPHNRLFPLWGWLLLRLAPCGLKLRFLLPFQVQILIKLCHYQCPLSFNLKGLQSTLHPHAPSMVNPFWLELRMLPLPSLLILIGQIRLTDLG